LATKRKYRAQDAQAALIAFRRSRGELGTTLRSFSKKQRRRCGLRDGLRRVSVEDLVVEIHEHDQTHVLEIDELPAELDQE
jgi:hypothetical protein